MLICCYHFKKEERSRVTHSDEKFKRKLLNNLDRASGALVTKCKSDDSKCAKESAQAILAAFAAGLPEHHVKTLDPLNFKKIDASSPNLNLIFTDATIKGLKDCLVKKVKRDKAKSKIFLKLMCSAQVEGKYEMKGRLLILPIEGNGLVHATIRKFEISVDAALGETKSGGVTYWNIKEWTHSYALKDKSDVIFDNLFDGNEVLAAAARDVISSSGNEIILEVGPPIIKAVAEEVISNVKAFFQSVPAQELAID